MRTQKLIIAALINFIIIFSIGYYFKQICYSISNNPFFYLVSAIAVIAVFIAIAKGLKLKCVRKMNIETCDINEGLYREIGKLRRQIINKSKNK